MKLFLAWKDFKRFLEISMREDIIKRDVFGYMKSLNTFDHFLKTCYLSIFSLDKIG